MRHIPLIALVPIAVAATAPAALADQGRYVARPFVEPATEGLPVTGPLSEFRVVARARVVTPAEWRVVGRRTGELRLLTPDVRSCRYRVVFTVRTVLGPPTAAADRVAAALPSPGAHRLLDSGQRGRSAFRVVRDPSVGGVVRLRALRAAVLTQRADIAPSGQVAWSEVGVTATSRVGDECHAGSWRERLGPQIGDALATARTTLRFVRPGASG